jgi:glycosyltransferase involved in cell wall biosynthesis
MNIFIDVRLCSYGYQGVKTYIDNILPYLLKSEHIFYLAGYRNYIEKFKNFRNVKLIEFEAPIHSLKEQILGWEIKEQIEKLIDVYFFPYPAVPIAFYNCDFVVKLHDVTPFKFWYHYNPLKVLFGFLITRLISIKAKRIIAVSETTKNDLIKFFNIYDKKIKVIYDGVSEVFKVLPKEEINEFKTKNNLKNFILYVGNREKTKNLFRLIKAVEILRKEGVDLELVIVGRKFKKYDKIDKKILNYGSWIKIFYDVSEEELVKFYNACELYVQPSLNEGFGLPVVEAMRCGCCCVLSDIPIFREITDNKGIYFDPYHVNDMVEKIREVLKNSDIKSELIKKFLEISYKFNWENSANLILKSISYEEINF